MDYLRFGDPETLSTNRKLTGNRYERYEEDALVQIHMYALVLIRHVGVSPNFKISISPNITGCWHLVKISKSASCQMYLDVGISPNIRILL